MAPLLVSFFAMFWSFSFVFIYCELGERVFNAFSKVNYWIEQIDWFLLPLRLQQMITMITAATQLYVVFTCFESTLCVREAYKKVRTINQAINQ